MAKKITTCQAVYRGPTAANGGKCLRKQGHKGKHRTHGVVSSLMTPEEAQTAVKNGFKW